ncbi:MAG: glycosyltransferase family 4 protein [Pyrinomonadaceae bacterium]|nr:glycosyltransferase family 4 protein [Pyrinomonadaceae bacterium]
MRILIYSPAFYPSIGGLETLVSILAHEFIAQGHEVRLVSQTPSKGDERFPFKVIRQPSPFRLLKLVRWCDLFFQPNISLKGIWPLFLTFKPWVVSHNNWYTRADGRLAWQDRLKHFLVRFANSISVSRAVAAHIAVPSTVIPNTYREDIFRLMPEVERDRELLFLGRLVSDKGADLLLDALAKLKACGLTPRLTIVGGGPEKAALHQQAEDLRVHDQIDFAGIKTHSELPQILNAHRILVVPSRWHEPFGIVALEGIACGCTVVGSEGGGLRDAVGSCGVAFPNGDAEALAQTLADLLSDPGKLSVYEAHREAHLSRHRKSEVAKAYLQVFEEAIWHRRIEKTSARESLGSSRL